MTHFCSLLSELMHVCLELLWLWLGAAECVVGAKGVGAEVLEPWVLHVWKSNCWHVNFISMYSNGGN